MDLIRLRHSEKANHYIRKTCPKLRKPAVCKLKDKKYIAGILSKTHTHAHTYMNSNNEKSVSGIYGID